MKGGERNTTNNRMEMTAPLMALLEISEHRHGLPIVVISDSQYLVNTMTRGWRRNKNLDLWHQLDQVVALHTVDWEWVRGHSGVQFNEEADRLANQGREELTYVELT